MQRAHPRSTTRASRGKSILVEGWRVTNHSLALVNQYQLAELCHLPGLRLFHRDVPLPSENWLKQAGTSGFSTDDRSRIDALTEPVGRAADCIYRIASPFQAGAGTTFIVAEYGLCAINFAGPSTRPEDFTRDASRIITPSRWSRDRLVDWGFGADKISVIPHGVDATFFRPSDEQERRASRSVFGITDDEVVFLNVGAAVWNKGVDLLLLAFAKLRGAGRRIRLILRDRTDLFGVSIATDIGVLARKNPGLFTAETFAAISVIAHDLPREHLRLLYGAADCYVSPYRAEGFNLPVLAAIACGTRVIVTRGGATDDFCNDQVAVRIRGTTGHHDLAGKADGARFITPDLGDLIEAMDCFAARQNVGLDQFEPARAQIVERFSWRNAAIQPAWVTIGYSGTA